MLRRAFLALFAQRADATACPIEILIGDKAEVWVSVPNVRKEDIVGVVSTFLGEGPRGGAGRSESDIAASVKKMHRVLSSSPNVTLTLTTRCEAAPPPKKARG
jgi:hypothetical protein